ncbi:MAG: recombinase family protein, partial [Bdellovibrionales bacterium]|nr:recombinase family protein [Bdellovibrionales bacterium]
MNKVQSHQIAFYIRVSTEEQAENPEGSIRNQEERLRDTVQFKNRERPFGKVAGIFIDRARSGKDTNRPELQRLLAGIRRREITLVMVTELSRLSRSIKDFAEMWEMMQAQGCAFQSLRENFDTTTASGEMVLFSLANIAQFERRQVAERVTANIVARASRGLYNGGPVPLGYQLIPEKHGYLAVDEEQAPVVRQAFATFLKERSLVSAARSLNASGVKYKRQMQGGGNAPRLGHFTADNLYCILKNKAYVGIKAYQAHGEPKETRAVWEPIIDEDTFERVQEILKKNYRRSKRNMKNRYPFLIAGLAVCGQCGERLSGKSAYGKCAKIPYYEHAWSTKRQACLVEKCFHCDPRRVLAKRIEPLIWKEVENLLNDPEVANELLSDARAIHAKRTPQKDQDRIQGKIHSISSQIDALAERIAQLPKTISAEPFYKQMEKLQASKTGEEEKLRAVQGEGGPLDAPSEIASYQAFLEGIRRLSQEPMQQELRAQITSMLIQKVEIFPNTFRLHFLVGKNYIDRELASAGSLVFLCPKSASSGKPRTGEPLAPFEKSASKFYSSKSVDNGVPTGIRTPVTAVKGRCPRPL